MKLSDIKKHVNQLSKQGYPDVSKAIKTTNKEKMLSIVKDKVNFLNANSSNTKTDSIIVESKRLVKKSKRDSKSHNHSRPRNHSKSHKHSKPQDNSVPLVDYWPSVYQWDTSLQQDFQSLVDWDQSMFPELIEQDLFKDGLSNIDEEPTEPGTSSYEDSSQNNQIQTQFHINNNIGDHNQNWEEGVTISASKCTNSPFLYSPITPEITPSKITPPLSPPTPTSYHPGDSVLPKPVEELTQEEAEKYFTEYMVKGIGELTQTFEDNEFTNNINYYDQSQSPTNSYTSNNYQCNSTQYNNDAFTNVGYNDKNCSYSSYQLDSESNVTQLDDFSGFEKLVEYNNSTHNVFKTNQTTNGSYLPVKPMMGLTDKQIEKAKAGKFEKIEEYPLDLQRRGLTNKEKKKIVSTDGITKRKRANQGGQKVMTKDKIDEFNRQTQFILEPQFRSVLRLTPALAGSLKCAVDYGNYYGDGLKQIQQVPQLTNTATTDGRCHHKKLQDMPALNNCDKRIKYSRDLTNISESVTNMFYTKNEHFDQNHPYNPQWFRGELDREGNSVSSAKCGLCPYCPEIKFFGYRNGGYLGHLASDHGIGSNNYLVPEGINYGIYKLPKSDSDPTLIESTGVECPYCHVAVKVGAQKNKNELLGYFRHWKTVHKDVTMNNLNTKITGHFRASIVNKKDQ